MRIREISLSWFRGAGNHAILDTGLKNAVVYGCNGSGKSCFSDAIEYVVKGGKIGHLAHEYSGSRQEKGTINTHAPVGTNATISITFEGSDSVNAIIAPDGTPSFDGNPKDLVDAIQAWELERILLRQDDVQAFVKKTKGEKYSVLLPLLGLEHLEQAAENIIEFGKSIEDVGELRTKTAKLKSLKEETSKYFPELSEEKVLDVLQSLAKDHIRGEIPTKLEPLVDMLLRTMNERLDSLDPEVRRHTLLTRIDGVDLLARLEGMVEAEEKLLGKVDALLDSRIEILEQSSRYIERLGEDKKEVECPACGRMIRTDEFDEHVRRELQALADLRSDRDAAREAREVCRSSIGQLLSSMGDESISAWLDLYEQKELKEALGEVSGIDEKQWEGSYLAEDKAKLCKAIPIVVKYVKATVAAGPPSDRKLIGDRDVVEAGMKVISAIALEEEIAMMRGLTQALSASESRIRNAVRSRANETIKTISGDIKTLWERIHPKERIEDVHLYLPAATDKAIDIGLKFYGVEQPSPRLTLSDGHRNSLGLCIFLALARLGDSGQRPIVLDDIISSLDRWHRGNVVDLLQRDLTERQVLLFVHEREWFRELRLLLPPEKWKFLVLKPWDSPSLGLQWFTSEGVFEDARMLVSQDCEAAGNRVRAGMDTCLAIAAEKLKIKMPYLRGDHNDRRTCIEFLERIMSEAKKRLLREEGGSWKEYLEPIDDWKEAHNLVAAFANPASHTGSLVPGEFEKLRQACEVAIGRFKCSECDSYIWTADQTGKKIMQCRCGKMQWRYG